MLARSVLLVPLSLLLIVAGCSGGDSNGDDEGPPPPDTAPTTGLPETYPVQLSLPGSELVSSDESLADGGVRATAVWTTDAEVADILDFFANALAGLDTPGEPDRLELGSVGALTYQGATDGPTYASVEVESTGEGLRTVTVAYLVGVEAPAQQGRAETPTAVSPDDAGNGSDPNADTDANDDPEDEVEQSNPPRTSARELLLTEDDLPARPWRVSNGSFLEVDFTTAFFDPTSCGAVNDALDRLEVTTTLPTDVASRAFSYSEDLTLVRLAFAVATFDSPLDANALFVALDRIVDAEVRACFEDVIAEALAEAGVQGIPLETTLREPDFVLARSSALEAHAQSTIALTDLSANLQLHVIQRGLAVAILASTVANDSALVDALPNLLAEFDRRLGGTSESASSTAGTVIEQNTGGSGDGEPEDTPPPPGTPPDDEEDVRDGTATGNSDPDADPGARLAGGAIPPALIHPDGPGAWTSDSGVDSTVYHAAFNVDSQTVDEILNFYQNAFASLGAPTVTGRSSTPFSGELTAEGPGGRGTVRIIASTTTRAVQANFVQFN